MTKITGACENVDTLYALNHFDKKAYLAQTGQLYLEAKIPLHKKVWTTIVSSRAEAKVDSRHLNQFTLIEFEQQGDFTELLPTIEEIVQNMVKKTIELNEKELKKIGRLKHLQNYLKPFKRITYTEAVNIVGKEWGEDFSHEDEMKILQETGNLPMFITHFPQEIKFFNMRVNRENKNLANSADLLLPFSGEACGSAERENDFNILMQRLNESQMFKILSKRGVSINEFKDYLDLVKANPILHAGGGIGFNRVVQSVLGLLDIRQTTNYPINAKTLY